MTKYDARHETRIDTTHGTTSNETKGTRYIWRTAIWRTQHWNIHVTCTVQHYPKLNLRAYPRKFYHNTTTFYWPAMTSGAVRRWRQTLRNDPTVNGFMHVIGAHSTEQYHELLILIPAEYVRYGVATYPTAITDDVILRNRDHRWRYPTAIMTL